MRLNQSRTIFEPIFKNLYRFMDAYGKEENMRNVAKQGYGGICRDIKTDIPTIPTMKTLGGKEQ